MTKQRKTPQRMCIGCQEMFDKKDLIRVVRTPESEILLDSTGKKAGRGAYLCPREECLTKAIKAKRLERAFKQSVSAEVLAGLKEQLVTGQ